MKVLFQPEDFPTFMKYKHPDVTQNQARFIFAALGVLTPILLGIEFAILARFIFNMPI